MPCHVGDIILDRYLHSSVRLSTPGFAVLPLSTTREIGLYPHVPLQRPPSIVLL